MAVNDPSKLTPEQAHAFHNLQEEGKTLSAKGKLIEALAKFEEALFICDTVKVQKRIFKLKSHLGLQLTNSNELGKSNNLSESKLETSNSDTIEKFNRLKSEGRKLAEEGCFHEAIELLRQADLISPSAKIQKWIKKLEALIQEKAEAEKILVKDPKDLTPQRYENFCNLKKSAMQLSLNGKFKEALKIFEEALQICESPDIQEYIKEMKKIIHSQAEKLAAFEGLAEKGQKLLKEGKNKESLETLKKAYSVCPSPSVLKIIKSLEDKETAAGDGASPDLLKRTLHYSSGTDEPEQIIQPAVPKIFSTRISDIPQFKRPKDPAPYEQDNFFDSTENSKTTESTPIRGSAANAAVSTPSPTDLNPKALSEFQSFQNKAKQCASEGKMKNALDHLYEAKSICQTPKLLKKIKTLEDYLKNNSDEDCDKMFEICEGFSIYHEIYKKLYPYQREGVIWMWGLHKKRKGGVLGDDMGLGKTFQVIAFLSGVIDAEAVKTILIIMPVSLLENWKREFNKWCPGISVHEFHGGSKKERERSLNRVQRRGNVLLTSYGMVVTSLESLTHCEGRQFVWDYVVLDEGHKIKNPTKQTKAVHDIPSKNRIVLTGTPVQNNLRELWALYDFSHQGTLLGSLKTFKMQYENIIIRSREKDATAGEKRLGMEMAENLKRIIKPYFLRRTKSEVLQNKPNVDDLSNDLDNLSISKPMKLNARKNDLIVWLKMCDAQSQIYSDFLESDTVKMILMTKKSPLVQLTVLKKICDHPRLLSQKACLQLGLNGEISEEDLQSEIENESTSTSSIVNVSDDTLMKESVKLKFLIDLLENLRTNGHRTLVFSLSRKILDMIQRILVNKKWRVLRIDGTINKMEERERRIQLFQKDASFAVFLLTTQVGGVGITLTAADRVVIYDPSWNPATDAQAVDRVYRIGQQKNVVIYRLITCATVEEKIYRRQIFKDSITRQATTNSTDPHRYFSKQELRELFSIDDPNYSATQVQLSELHSSERKTDISLDEHIAFLYSLDIFGISDHDLMFTKEIKDETEDHCEAAVSHEFIKQTVNSAQMLIQTESSVVEEGIRLAGSFKRPFQESIPTYKKNTEKDKYKPPVFPVIIDVTDDDLDEKFNKSPREVLETPNEGDDFEIGNYSPIKAQGIPEINKKLSRGSLTLNTITTNDNPEINLHDNKKEENNSSHRDSGNVDSFPQSLLKIDQVRSPVYVQNNSRASLLRADVQVEENKDFDSVGDRNVEDIDTDTQSTVKIEEVESPVYKHDKSRPSQDKYNKQRHLDLPENLQSMSEKTPSPKANSLLSMGIEVEEVNISDNITEKIGDSPSHERSQCSTSHMEEDMKDSMHGDEKVEKYFQSMTEEPDLVKLHSDISVENDKNIPDPNALVIESVESPSRNFKPDEENLDQMDDELENDDEENLDQMDDELENVEEEKLNVDEQVDHDEQNLGDTEELKPRTSSPTFDKSIIGDLEIQVDENVFPLLGSLDDDFLPRVSIARRKSCARRATVVISDSDSQQSGPTSADNSGEIIVSESDNEDEFSDAESDLSTTPEPDASKTSVVENSFDELHSITLASFDSSTYSDKSETVNGLSSDADGSLQDMVTSPLSHANVQNKRSEFKPKLFGADLERTPDKTIEAVKRITPLRVNKEYNKSPHPSPFEMAFNSSNPLITNQAVSNLGSNNWCSPNVNDESPILRVHKLKGRRIVSSDSEDSS